MTGVAVNTMIEDNSIECEDSKILNTHQDFNIANAMIPLQNPVAKKELIEHSESGKTTPPPSKDDDSVKDESVTQSLSSEQVTVVENIDTTVPKIVNLSDVSDDGECGSLKYFDEIYSSDKHESTYEPEWSGAVGRKGDVFYVEADEARHGRQSSTVATSHENSSNNEDDTNRKSEKKSKKSIKKSVKTLITANKKDSKVEVKQEQRNNLRNGVQQNGHSPSVTFNDRPTGMIKDVRLFVDPSRNNYGRRASLCESLFGIVPGNFNSKPENHSTSIDNRIMVQALLPGNEAIKSGDIKIGDWLMCVNDGEINLDNMDNVLSMLTSPMHVKLTLQKLAVLASPPHLAHKKVTNKENLVKIISGTRLNIPPPSLHNLVHGVLYLTLDVSQDSAQAKEDILYQFGVGAESKLIDIRGLFTTLTHMLPDVTQNTAKNSTLLVDGQLVHVGYKKDKREVLVMAFPAHKMCALEVKKLVADMTRVIKVLYGSLHSAFRNAENHRRLDHLFSLVFQRNLLAEELLLHGSRQTQFVEPMFDIVPGVRAISLPEETKVLISNCLSELEAADFADMSEDYYELRRSYCLLGSCLFYKGYLTQSHLPKEDLFDIYLYLKYHCLLTLCNEEQMGQMVVWTEVFPWRRCHMPQDPLIPGYIEPDARWFLLVVGMKNSMLAILLEAGGCAEWVEGHPPPDPFYVDQVKATLLQLESLDVLNQCEIRLLSPAVPSLSSIDWFFPHNKSSKDDNPTQPPLVKVHLPSKAGAVSPSKKLLQPESILKKRSNASPRGPRSYGRGAVYDVESDEVDSQSTGNSDNSTPIMDRRHRKPSVGSDESTGSAGSSGLFKGNKKKRTMLSAYDVSGLKRGLADITADERTFVKLTSGCNNTLFHYIQLDEQEGVFICPTQQELVQIISATHNQLLLNFHTACIAIHQVIGHAARVEEVKSAGETTGKFGLDDSLGNVYEHGVLFQCTPHTWTDSKKSLPSISYWVVGRRMRGPHHREFYVCFHDSAQQNLIELAFKLGFGLIT